jgi:hypothetical protein
LHFINLQTYEFTFNEHGQFNQTQLAILCDIPSDETISLFQPFSVLAAPPGVKDIDFEIVSKQQLIDLHWKECQAVVAPQFTRSLQGGMKAKRQQYGLRPHISGTLHAVMGSTLFKVATEINIKGTGNQLWEKGQAVVLVSRTKRCKDLIFVGDKQATLDVITSLVQVQTQYDKYINHILNVLTAGTNSGNALQQHRVIEDNVHVLRPNDIPLPEAGIGCCYLLVSTKNFNITYIGQTMRHLGTRLHEHNSGAGALSTRDQTLRPWGLLAFVTGFDGDVNLLKAFESLWEARRFSLFREHRADLSIDQIVNAGRDIMLFSQFQGMELRLVVKGHVRQL